MLFISGLGHLITDRIWYGFYKRAEANNYYICAAKGRNRMVVSRNSYDVGVRVCVSFTRDDRLLYT